MASGKERLRISRILDRYQDRIKRQKEALSRLVDANIAMTAALMQIANEQIEQEDFELEGMVERMQKVAQDTLAVVAKPAAAAESEARELIADDGSADKEEDDG
jgi:hypothetical protein